MAEQLKIDLIDFTFLSENTIYLKLMNPEGYKEFIEIMKEELGE